MWVDCQRGKTPEGLSGKFLTSDAYEFLGAHGHELFLEQTCSAALDAVQLLVHFVGAVK